MNENQVRGYLRTIDLLELQDAYRHEAGCEMQHNAKHPCSGDVVGRQITCAGAWLMCRNSFDNITKAIDDRRVTCADCAKPAEDCWRVVPV